MNRGPARCSRLASTVKRFACATAGNVFVGNAIDLRPFYAMSPNVSMLLPYGVTKATVSFTYPDAYKVR